MTNINLNCRLVTPWINFSFDFTYHSWPFSSKVLRNRFQMAPGKTLGVPQHLSLWVYYVSRARVRLLVPPCILPVVKTKSIGRKLYLFLKIWAHVYFYFTSICAVRNMLERVWHHQQMLSWQANWTYPERQRGWVVELGSVVFSVDCPFKELSFRLCGQCNDYQVRSPMTSEEIREEKSTTIL